MGITVQVSDLSAVRKRLKTQGFKTRDMHDRAVCEAGGAIIAFETA